MVPYFKNHTEQIGTMCGQNAEFLSSHLEVYTNHKAFKWSTYVHNF